MKQKIKLGRLFRAANSKAATVSDDRRARISFSSEDPYERFFGMEILGHDKSEVRMGRLLNKAPLLAEHDTTKQIGVIEGGSLEGGRGFVDILFSKNQLGEEYMQDVKDGVRTHVSVGYIVHNMDLEEKAESDTPTFRVTDWEPLEVSFVSVAADDSVGFGRSDDKEWVREIEYDDGTKEETKQEEPTMAEENKVTVVDNGPSEAQRQKDIRDCAAMITDMPEVADLARKFQDEGGTVGDFMDAVRENRGASKPIADSAEIGMSDKEVQTFSLVRMINAMANPKDRGAQDAAAFEFECSIAAAKRSHKTPEGMILPADVVMRGQTDIAKRDITAGPGGTGQYLVDTSMMTMIEALQNNMVLTQMGATTFTGLVGDIAFPRENAQATTYWLGEGEDVTESDPGFNQLNMTPKTVGAYSDLTRKIMQQSSIDVENWLRGHLALKLAIRMDLAGIHGTGADGQPLGITNTSGIGSVVGGTNGADPTFAHMVGLETQVAQDNALRGRMGFLTNTKVRGVLRQTPENASVPNSAWVWQGGLDGSVVGYPAVASNQVSSTLLKSGSSATGEHSAVIFGNFNDLYMGFWGGLDINVDTSALSKSGGVRIIALQDADIGLAHVESFAAMLDATT